MYPMSSTAGASDSTRRDAAVLLWFPVHRESRTRRQSDGCRQDHYLKGRKFASRAIRLERTNER
jgi:hypothetical protein